MNNNIPVLNPQININDFSEELATSFIEYLAHRNSNSVSMENGTIKINTIEEISKEFDIEYEVLLNLVANVELPEKTEDLFKILSLMWKTATIIDLINLDSFNKEPEKVNKPNIIRVKTKKKVIGKRKNSV